MSALPPPPPWGPPPGWYPVPPPPPPLPPRRANALRLLAVVGVLLAGGAAAAGYLLLRDDPYPDEWDPRVADLVAFVEDERRHDFEHPVAIDFLTPEAYAELTRTDVADLDEAAIEAAEQAEGFLRALGLVTGDVDLLEAGNDINDTGTLAFYDPDTERVVVRGTEVDTALAVTLVHELTHVLQDQTLDLRDLDDPSATSGEQFAYRALVEGDAVRIENRYIAQELSPEDVAALDATSAADLAAVEAEGIPEALQAFFGMPYALGESFVRVLEQEGGTDGVDDAFADPPTTEEHLVDPLSFLEGDDADRVDAPLADEGATVLERGDFGAASLYLVLAQRIAPTQALEAATGWGGDAYVNFAREGRSCIALVVAGDDEAETEQLAAALDAWVATTPGGSASVTRREGDVRLDACDPGTDATAEPASAIGSLQLLAVHNAVLADGLAQGADRAFASCYADAIIHTFSVDELVAATEPTDLEARLAAAAASCGG